MYHFSDFVRSSGRSMKAAPGLGDGTSTLQLFCLIVTSITSDQEYWGVWWSTVAGLWGQPLVWAEVTMVVLRHQCSEFRVSATHPVHSAHSSFMLTHCTMKLCTYKLYSYSLQQDWTMSNNELFLAVKQGVSIDVQNTFSLAKSCRHSLDKRKQQNWISWHIYFLRRAPH